jgi:hypothetical protein
MSHRPGQGAVFEREEMSTIVTTRTSRAARRRQRFAASLVSLAAALLSAGPATAQSFEGARLLGFGGAQRALSTGNDSLYVNPAGLAMAKTYSLELGMLDDLRGSDRRFNASVVDGQAGPVAGGLAYTYFSRRPDAVPSGDDRAQGHRLDVGAATLLSESIALGASVRYLRYRTDSVAPEAADSSTRDFDLVLGLEWRLVDGLFLGVVAQNLLDGQAGDGGRSFSAGLGYASSFGLSVEGDVLYDQTRQKTVLSGALGYVVAERVPLRAGVTYDQVTGAVLLSLGLGVQYERLGLDVGYRQRLSPDRSVPDGDERVFALALRLSVL